MTPEQLYHECSLQHWGRAIESELTRRLSMAPIPEHGCFNESFFVSTDQYSFPYRSTLDEVEEEADRIVDLLLKRDKRTECQVLRWYLCITRDGIIEYNRQFRQKIS